LCDGFRVLCQPDHFRGLDPVDFCQTGSVGPGVIEGLRAPESLFRIDDFSRATQHNAMRILLAFIFITTSIAALFGAFEFVAVPIQSIETKAELQQSQRSGRPISDADIERHLSRAGHERWRIAFVAVPAGIGAFLSLIGLLVLDRKQPA
jgi:hypothetical protein